MNKFVYQMQNVLNIKMKLESQEKIAFANAQMKLREEENKMDQMKEKKSYYEDKLRNEMKEKLDVKEMSSCNHGIKVMKEFIKVQQLEVNVAMKNVDKAHARLSEAMKERKTHEKLRENAFEEYIQESNLEEKREIDEIVTYNYSSMV